MLYYITSNQNKIAVAKKYLEPFGIVFRSRNLDLTEIQSHDIRQVVEGKAKEAFRIIKKPLFVNDHFWSIPALNGFPGAYMKHINGWFTPEDFLRLMKDKPNRDAILTEAVCYIDKNHLQTFTMQIKGTILEKPQGKGLPALTVISLSGDGQSIAKKLEKDVSAAATHRIWGEFAEFYKQNS